jgi:hypothetical protein
LSFDQSVALDQSDTQSSTIQSFLRIVLINARSLKNKLNDLDYTLNVCKPGILCVTESWLRPSITNNSIHNSCYSLFRKDRHDNREGGGVCIFTNNDCTSASQVFLPDKFISLELIVIDVVLSASLKKFRLFYVTGRLVTLSIV